MQSHPPPGRSSHNSPAGGNNDGPKTVYLFFEKSVANPKTGTVTEYKFSYDCEAYYFQMERIGVGMQQTLVLPINRSTVKLVEEYSCNMDGLIKRLKVDKKTGSLFIKDFKRPPTIAKRTHSADAIAESMNVSVLQQQSPRQGPSLPQTTQRNMQD